MFRGKVKKGPEGYGWGVPGCGKGKERPLLRKRIRMLEGERDGKG